MGFKFFTQTRFKSPGSLNFIIILNKSELMMGLDSTKVEKLSEGLQDTLEDHILSLHGISEGSKGNHASQVRTFERFLINRGIKRSEDASSKNSRTN